MGVFLNYAFHIECAEADLLERMRRLRSKLKQLPFDSVSRVLRVDPAYQSVQLALLPAHGSPLPRALSGRLRGKLGPRHDDLCHLAAPTCFMLVPEELQRKFYEPAIQF